MLMKTYLLLVLASLPCCAIARSGLPAHCDTDQARNDMTSQIPHVMGLEPGAATITNVKLLSDTPLVTYMPPMQGEQALHLLTCPITIEWSTGHEDTGWFEEWEDHYGQVQVYFGHDPEQPH